IQTGKVLFVEIEIELIVGPFITVIAAIGARGDAPRLACIGPHREDQIRLLSNPQFISTFPADSALRRRLAVIAIRLNDELLDRPHHRGWDLPLERHLIERVEHIGYESRPRALTSKYDQRRGGFRVYIHLSSRTTH